MAFVLGVEAENVVRTTPNVTTSTDTTWARLYLDTGQTVSVWHPHADSTSRARFSEADATKAHP